MRFYSRLVSVWLLGCACYATAQTQEDPAELLRTAAILHGLVTPTSTPWHLRATYTMLDAKGKRVNTGVYEVFWDGPKKMRQSFAGKALSQTDYTTDKGSFRIGEMNWPSMLEQRVPDLLFLSLPGDPAHGDYRLAYGQQAVEGVMLRCFQLLPTTEAAQNTLRPTYCLELETPQLRYTSGVGRNVIEQMSTTHFSNTFLFRGRPVSRDIAVFFMEHPSLTIHIDVLEDLPAGSDTLFVPPANAGAPPPMRHYVDQMHMEPRITKRGTANFGILANPTAFDGRGMLVVVVGKDGKVLEVRPLIGPSMFEAGEIQAVQKQTYQPVVVDGVPVEVETEVMYSLAARR